MARSDARVPLRLGPPSAIVAGDAVLIEGAAPVPSGHPTARFTLPVTGHVTGCLCCLPRGPVAEALLRLFQARARGEVAFFRAVLAIAATPAGTASIRAALTEDVFVAARFRLT